MSCTMRASLNRRRATGIFFPTKIKNPPAGVVGSIRNVANLRGDSFYPLPRSWRGANLDLAHRGAKPISLIPACAF
jgi:hypothetical protein